MDTESNAATFFTESEAIDVLAKQISKHTDERLARDVARELVPVFRVELESARPSLPRRELIVSRFRWVIRDDDLQLASAICTGLQAAAGVAFFAAAKPTIPQTTAAVTGVVIALFRVLSQAVRKGVRLDPLSFAVLAALHNSKDGETGDTLTQRLNQNPSSTSPRTEKEILRELQRLERVILSDGSVTSLVSMDPDGRWYASGI